MANELLTAEEVTKIIGVASKATLYSWVAKGLFPQGAKLGPKLRRWRRDDIEKWQRDNGLIPTQ